MSRMYQCQKLAPSFWISQSNWKHWNLIRFFFNNPNNRRSTKNGMSESRGKSFNPESCDVFNKFVIISLLYIYHIYLIATRQLTWCRRCRNCFVLRRSIPLVGMLCQFVHIKTAANRQIMSSRPSEQNMSSRYSSVQRSRGSIIWSWKYVYDFKILYDLYNLNLKKCFFGFVLF